MRRHRTYGSYADSRLRRGRDDRGLRVRSGVGRLTAVKESGPVQRAARLSAEKEQTTRKENAEGAGRHDPASENERSNAPRSAEVKRSNAESGTAAERPANGRAPGPTKAPGKAAGSDEADDGQALIAGAADACPRDGRCGAVARCRGSGSTLTDNLRSALANALIRARESRPTAFASIASRARNARLRHRRLELREERSGAQRKCRI